MLTSFWPKYYRKWITVYGVSSVHATSQWGLYYYPHFADEKTEAQLIWVSYWLQHNLILLDYKQLFLNWLTLFSYKETSWPLLTHPSERRVEKGGKAAFSRKSNLLEIQKGPRCQNPATPCSSDR